MKKFFYFISLYLLITALQIFAQAGTYYDALDVNSPNFVNDLKARIRSPYTKISYDQFDETNIANFSSINNGNGTRSVFCVYSNYEHIYSGTFTWGTMSREHTFCHSWMPTYPSESGEEYSDQYHLYPTHQNNANGRRSNHPLGDVTIVTYQFMEGKLGKNSLGETVYESRAEHKGDAARAILYMLLRYDGINGNTWTLNWLNNTRLPSLNEAPQRLETLLQYHKQDPPSKREIERTNYVQSIQKNRNPLIDHPEYINYIDFNTITKLNPTFAPEPTNYPTNLSAIVDGNTITLSWEPSTGAQLPSGYFVIAYDKDDYFLPIDGEVYTEDTQLGDGKALVYVPASSNSYSFSSLANTNKYYFTVFPYNGENQLINYKINGTLPRVLAVQALPVELVSFSAICNENKVTLNWITATEENNSGFQIERRNFDDVNYWTTAGFINGAGTTTLPQNYSFTDVIEKPGKYVYRLKQLDYDGSFIYSKEITVEVLNPKSFNLMQNYPNPFNPATKITFSLPRDSKVALKVYDLLGREVALLTDGYYSAGTYTIDFDASGLNSGIYIYKMEADGFVSIRKMTLMK
jgi:endonuclease I